MCIRDRPDRARAREMVEQRLAVAPPDRPRQFRQILLKLACLLYTSDAADERSSVDLGGRRIIKKKKRALTG